MSKFLKNLFNPLIEIFFVTNVWIFLFNNILKFLNHKYPPPTINNIILDGFSAPEPFEIPLYLLLTFISVLIIYFFHKKIGFISNYFSKFDQSRLFRFAKFIFFVLLFGIFINNLGSYPMGKDTFPLTGSDSGLTHQLYLFGYLFFTGLIIFESNWLDHFIHKKYFFLWFYLGLLLIIGFLTFRPGFPISWHDYPYIYGPVSEVVQGKTIHNQIQSQYGFLLILILAIFSKIHLFNLSVLPILIWIFYGLEYFLFFYLVFKLSRSFVLSFIGLFSIITINYYSLCCAIAFPQIGPLRWLPIILLIFLFYKSKKIDNYWFIFVLSLLSFLVVDVGIAILMAYSFSLFIFTFVGIIDIKRLIRNYLFVGLTLISVFTLINLVGLFFGYQLIDIGLIFTKIREYAHAGFGMLPITTKTFFWLTVLVYFSSIIYFFKKNKFTIPDQVLLFSANITLFTSIYFVGRSHPLNLFVTAIFLLLTFFILMSRLYTSEIFSKSFLLRTLLQIILFLTLVAYPAFARKEMLTINFKEALTKLIENKKIFDPGIETYLKSYLSEEINLINKYLPGKEALIISTDDTYLLYLTDKASLMNVNPLTAIISQSDVDFSLKKVYQTCPKKIAIDCYAVGKCPFTWKLNYFIYPYQKIIDPINQRCHLNYQPEECTDQLCIMIAN